MLERILQEIEAKGNIQFSSYTKPLIAVEDVVKIIQAYAGDNLLQADWEDRGRLVDADKVVRRLKEKIDPNVDRDTGEPCDNWVVDMQNELIGECIEIVLSELEKGGREK